MITLPRTAAVFFSLALVLSASACGSSSDSGDSPGSDGGSAATNDPGEVDEAPVATASGEVPSAEGSLDLADYRSGIGQDDLTDSDEFLKATQVLGEVDGYVTTDDELVVTGADGEKLQFLCIAKDQMTLDTYTVIVLQADGTRADC